MVPSPVGNYRYYYSEHTGKSCWLWYNYELEEYLVIRKDSTYFFEHLKPVGGPLFLPDSGKWTVDKNNLILHSQAYIEWKSPAGLERTFVLKKEGLKDLNNRSWKRRKILWKKE